MKQVYILRHAQKNEMGELTPEGMEKAKSLKNNFREFKIIIASDMPRAQETATLLTGIRPEIDIRAGYFNAPQHISDEINNQAKSNLNGFTGAYLENQEIKDDVLNTAQRFVDLILETLEKLNSEEKALIVSHDIAMIPAGELLSKGFDIQSFNYLSGYIIDDNKKLTPLSL